MRRRQQEKGRMRNRRGECVRTGRLKLERELEIVMRKWKTRRSTEKGRIGNSECVWKSETGKEIAMW